ncbi:MAG: hypothetical protein RL885_23090 [Planctomycetota bacterium]
MSVGPRYRSDPMSDSERSRDAVACRIGRVERYLDVSTRFEIFTDQRSSESPFAL